MSHLANQNTSHTVQQSTSQQIPHTTFPIIAPIPSVPIITNTPIQTDLIPEYIRNKILSSSQDMIFDSPMPGLGHKFDPESSRLFLPNPFCKNEFI